MCGCARPCLPGIVRHRDVARRTRERAVRRSFHRHPRHDKVWRATPRISTAVIEGRYHAQNAQRTFARQGLSSDDPAPTPRSAACGDAGLRHQRCAGTMKESAGAQACLRAERGHHVRRPSKSWPGRSTRRIVAPRVRSESHRDHMSSRHAEAIRGRHCPSRRSRCVQRDDSTIQ